MHSTSVHSVLIKLWDMAWVESWRFHGWVSSNANMSLFIAILCFCNILHSNQNNTSEFLLQLLHVLYVIFYTEITDWFFLQLKQTTTVLLLWTPLKWNYGPKNGNLRAHEVHNKIPLSQNCPSILIIIINKTKN